MALPKTKLSSSRITALIGDFAPPGDKSISHRSIMLGAIAEGTTTVRGLLEGDDVLNTAAAMGELGAKIHKDENDVWHIVGVGTQGLRSPANILDMGNSGTSARLLMGLMTGYNITARMTGDGSLRNRPMSRVIEPLKKVGATFESTDGKLPITLIGSPKPAAISYELPVASAQVKSAILLAGLNAEGITTVVERSPTRDHTENMLRGFGIKVISEKRRDGSYMISVNGKAQLKAQDITVPADPSSAAFPMVATVMCPHSRITLRNVCTNPRRSGLIDTLVEMGANIYLKNLREISGEPVADLVVSGGRLIGVDVPAERAPSMIDEYPILAVAAACAKGVTRMRGLGELRVKESDRLTLMADGLTKCGVKVEIQGDDMIVYGTGLTPHGGATVQTGMDHRIAMSFLVLGTKTAQPVCIDDGGFIATSFPGFVAMMNSIGAKIASAS